MAAGEETSRDPSAEDETTRDYGVPPASPGDLFSKPSPGAPGAAPGGFGSGYGDPLPPPWIPVPDPPEAGTWQAPPDHTTPMPPSGEHSTQLGQEPWAERSTQLGPEPWSEPAIWQPPAPAKRNGAMYFLVAAGVVLLVVIALGIVFWPSGSGKPARSVAGPASSPTGQTVTTEEESPTDSPTADASPSGDTTTQARAVDGLLEEMGQTRSELGTVVEEGCTIEGLQRIRDERQGQLDRANALDVSALDNGTAMKDALVRALRASVESNQRYLDVAPGCPSDDDVASANQEATDAKNEFIGYWAPIAQQVGLPARNGDNI
ncbi:hypothetical protein [Actinomadura opuntiae]|uniref:hypothetical protein n=1 Tax=Actinomadura sp. OS1-43 TaxID=604315 RepID=UPI00255ADC81|nr:hypothetical protein [Actinomadura sp. OS1-43]MDL4814857.1 hypothetical protein [Actinomadura sp. OS1-43]